MTRPLPVSEVVVGLLTENAPRMLVQAVRLVRSIRWFGGELASVRVVVCGVGPLEREAQQTLVALGAEIRTVARFHPNSPTGNRHQLIAELLGAPQKLLLLLDCDTVVMRNPLPHLRTDVFQAKIASTPTVTDEVFDRLFDHFGLSKPPRSHVTLTGVPTIAYFNAGVLAIPTALAPALASSWRKYNVILADRPELVAPCHRHLHQAALSLALVEAGVRYAELPEELNLQCKPPLPPESAATDPIIVHYHHLGSDDGFLLPSEHRGAQAAVDRFNERMRTERFVPEERVVASGPSRPIVVLGMHRSGTSVIAEVVRELGSYAGEHDALAAPDNFNPTGYWEHKEAVQIDTEILEALSADMTGAISGADLARLAPARRAAWVTRAKAVAQSLAGHGSFVLKDPRMSILLPLWREALEKPICVIAWRDPLAVAQSLLSRDRHPAVLSLASWEHHYRTILKDSEGLGRVLVSYEELVADPVGAVRKLHAALAGQGVLHLRLPSDERIRQIVNPDFNRSQSAAAGLGELLDASQKALVEGLRTGAAIHEPVAPTSPRTFALLRAGSQHRQLRAEVTELDQLLLAVFDSRAWRVGNAVGSLLRRVRPGEGLSVVERWQRARRRRAQRP